MAGFQCPYCKMIMTISNETCQIRYPGFIRDYELYRMTNVVYGESCVQLTYYKCPNCGKYTVFAKGKGSEVSDIDTLIRPKSLAIQFPEYIPIAIRQDYEEAYAILTLSPKASATLSRRCLQGMIRDFWKIQKSSLYKEIDELKDKVPADLWETINALRQLGNIGAHMEKDTNIIVDIDPNEAESLLKLIELLMEEWYINRENRKQLFSKIISTNEEKQNQRKNTE